MSPHKVQIGSAAQPGSHPTGTQGPLYGGKAAGSEADHSPQANAEVKTTWIYSSTPTHKSETKAVVKPPEAENYMPKE
jgi:hypothetical protein